jgi:hypothetical protein
MGHTINIANSVLSGAVAMASFVAMLFFLKFWRQTRDRLFLLFALAFGVDAVIRILLGLDQVKGEAEPFFYMARLVTFLLTAARNSWDSVGEGRPSIWSRRSPGDMPVSRRRDHLNNEATRELADRTAFLSHHASWHPIV